MAKKSNTTPQNATSARIARTEAYAEKVRAMFNATVNRILELNKTMPVIPDGEMFSFDAQTEKLRIEVERCLRQLHSVATTAIQQGIRLEWQTANAECDKIAQSVIGKSVIENPEFGAWLKRNNAAMRAFIARSDAGMNLSERVWQSTRQLRDEMEIAITVAVGDGTSAARMSRQVRKYLNDPDLMFRRFRYKDPETGEWKRKWKKRVIDPITGKVTFIDYDKNSYRDQWTGRGYYKSAAQNAMRVTRTETNIAYRRADNERWQQMDFVLGQRVQMSRNHPKTDICDKLAGDYPKDFVFDGWHPQCFCFVTPINLDADTMAEIMSHDNWREELKRITDAQRITDYPDNFKSWVTDNAANIEAARQRGTEPYFIRNNAGIIDDILNPDAAKSKREEQRRIHIEQSEDKFASRVLDIMRDVPGVDVSALEHAIKTGNHDDAMQQAKALRERGRVLKSDAKDAIRTAGTFREVDSTALSDAIKSGNIKSIASETASLQSAIDKMRQIESDLEKLIPDAHKWHESFTIAELQSTYAGVEKTLSGMPTDLKSRRDKLIFEIKWVEDKKKYPTWEAAQSAYKKELAFVERKIDEQTIADSVRVALAYALVTPDNEFMRLADEMRIILSTPNFDLNVARAKASALNKKHADLVAAQMAASAASIGASTPVRRETLDELKSRLGTDTPETVASLDKAIKKYERSSKYGDIAKQHKDEIEQIMRDVFDTHDFGMNIDEDVIDKVLTSWFKNTFEVGGGNGYVGSTKTTGAIETGHHRLGAAHRLFGMGSDLAKDQLPRNKYEKYGNLLDHNIEKSLQHGTATQYGNVEVRFKKDSVIATWTAGDSLGERWQPSLTTDPKSCSFDDYSGTPTSTTESITDLTAWKRKHICSYLELQYHGDLTVDCVESISYPYDLNDTKHATELSTALKWKAIGVKVYYLTSSGLMQL